MNYYKQGDAANADKIKAAFEELGYDTKHYTFDNDNLLFYTINGDYIPFLDGRIMREAILINLIKTHPDYKELELLVEPKFKVGDWVVFNGLTLYIKKIVKGYYITISKGGITNSYDWDIDNLARLWTIQDAKDGDVLVTTKIRSCPFIYRKTNYNDNLAYYYAGIDGNGDFCEGCLKKTLYHFGSVSDVIPATKEQRDLLFAKMKEAGYEWDADKKELRKIQPHYDIANFYAGMPVLVRDSDEHKWLYTIFGIYNKDNLLYPFVVVNMRGYEQCIPFNDDTRHLLGTADMCDEQYINW